MEPRPGGRSSGGQRFHVSGHRNQSDRPRPGGNPLTHAAPGREPLRQLEQLRIDHRQHRPDDQRTYRQRQGIYPSGLCRRGTPGGAATHANGSLNHYFHWNLSPPTIATTHYFDGERPASIFRTARHSIAPEVPAPLFPAIPATGPSGPCCHSGARCAR